MEYAGFWRRAAALSLDGVLLGVIQAVVNILLIAMIGATSVAGGEPGDAACLERGRANRPIAAPIAGHGCPRAG